MRFVDDIVDGKVAEYENIYDLNWTYLSNILVMKKRKFKELEENAERNKQNSK